MTRNIIFITLVLTAASWAQAAAPSKSGLDDLVTLVYQTEMLEAGQLEQINNLADLRILRNAIYAKKGYRFKSADLTAYFSRFAWYKPLYDGVEDQFSETDHWNLELILYREADIRLDALIKAVPPKKIDSESRALIGIWQAGPVMAAGWDYCLAFHPQGMVVERFSQMDCAKRLILRLGSWELKTGRLSIRYSHQLVLKGGRLIPSLDGGCGSQEVLIEARPALEEIAGGESQTLALSAEQQDDESPAWRRFGTQQLWKMRSDPWDYQ